MVTSLNATLAQPAMVHVAAAVANPVTTARDFLAGVIENCKDVIQDPKHHELEITNEKDPPLELQY